MGVIRMALLLAGMTVGPALAQDLPTPRPSPPEPIPVPTDSWVLGAGTRLRHQGDPLRDLTWTGAVVASDGAPLPGADVWLIPDGETLVAQGFHPRERVNYSGFGGRPPPFFDDVPLADLPHAYTGGDGRFELRAPWRPSTEGFDPLYSGLHLPMIVIASEGYATRVDQALTWHQVRGRPDDLVSLGELCMEPEARLSGRVVDESGAGLPGVRVRIESHECRPRQLGRDWYFLGVPVAGLHDAQTDAEGRFQIAGLFPGEATLEVFLGERGRLETRSIDLEPGESTVGRDLVLPAGETVSGRVLDTAGRPVPGAVVHAVGREREQFGFGCEVRSFGAGDDTLPTELSRRCDSDVLSTPVDGAGAFSLTGQWAGTITLYAEAPGFEAGRARGVRLGETNARLTLRASATFTVCLVDAESNLPVPVARLEAYRLGLEAERVVLAPDDTSFELPVARAADGAPGCWSIEGAGPVGTLLFVAADGYVAARQQLPGLAAPGHQDVTVKLVRGLKLEGRVLTDAGEPIAEATIRLTEPQARPDAFVCDARTAADGRFVIATLPAGVWDAHIEAPDWIPDTLEGVTVSVAAPPPELVVRLQRGGTIRGSLSPARCGAVTLRGIYLDASEGDASQVGRRSGRSLAYAQADNSGRFEFRGVRPGRYRVHEDRQPGAEVLVVAGQTVDVALEAVEDR